MEQGPELVNLPTGSAVHTANETLGILKKMSSSEQSREAQTIELKLHIENFNNNTSSDIEQIAEELAYLIKRKRIAFGG